MTRQVISSAALLLLVAPFAHAQGPLPRDLVPTQGVWLDNKPLTPLARIGMERQWFTAVPLTRAERVLVISLAENMIFVQTTESNLHAYDAETGRYLWGTNLGSSTKGALAASLNSKSVFATGSLLLFSLDRSTGRVQWTTKLEAMPSSGTAADEERVMVGLNTGKLATYSVKTHEPAFFWQTDGPLIGRPIPAGPVVAFGSGDARVYVAQKDPPKLVYRYRTGGPISASMGTYGTRTLLVPSGDNDVYAIDLFNGETRWTHTTGAPVLQEPLVAGKDVYVMNSRGFLSSVDAETGAIHWSISTGGGRLLSVGEKRVYLESPFRDLYIVDRTTGNIIFDPHAVRERAGLDIRDFDLTMTNHLTGRIFLASASGMVVCLREAGRQKPYMLRDPNAPPIGFIPRQGGAAPPPGAGTTPPAPEGAAGTPPPAPGDTTPPPAEGAVPPPGGAAGEAPK